MKAEVRATDEMSEVRVEHDRLRLEWRHLCLTHLIEMGREYED